MNLLRRSVRQMTEPTANNPAADSPRRLEVVVEREVCSVILTSEQLNYDQPCPLCGQLLSAHGHDGVAALSAGTTNVSATALVPLSVKRGQP